MDSPHVELAKVPREPRPDVFVAAEHVGHLLKTVIVSEVHQRQLVRAVAGRELAVAVVDILDFDGGHEARDGARLELTLATVVVLAVAIVLVLLELFLGAKAPSHLLQWKLFCPLFTSSSASIFKDTF